MRNSTQRNVARPARTGFTVTELLVVVAIIGLIVALVIPTIGKVRSKSRTLKCLTNQRTITMANYTYATSNQSRFASSCTNSGGTLYVNGADINNGTAHCWVKAEGPNLVTNQFEKPSALEQGSLYPYIGDVKTYISPDEPTNPLASNVSNTGTRVRSYSFNALLGITRPEDNKDYDGDFTSAMYGVAPRLSQYNSTTIGTIKSPQRMMATVVEDDSEYYNLNGWIIRPQLASWIDWPAAWRPDAITMSYVDGSTDSYALSNPDLPTAWDSFGHNYVQPADAGAGIAVDWKFFRDRLNPGVIPNSTYLFGN